LPVDLSLDATWARWSTWRGPFVRVTAELPLAGELEGQLPAVPWRDTFGVRLGAERALPRGFAVRGGAGFETSPVPARQPGVTNLLDGPKYTGALGLGWRSRDLGGRRLRIDLHVMAQVLGARTLAKTIAAPGEDPAPFDALRDEVRNDPAQPETLGAQISNPGYPTLDSGGQVFSGGMSLQVEL
jgi:long-subunit fatty acid transport protein